MNYFEELNKFWRSGITNYLTPNASLLYLCLLDYANYRHWPQRFAVTSSVLEENTGIAKRDTLFDARNRLNQIELIRFYGLRGSRIVEYEILGVDHAMEFLRNRPTPQPTQKKGSDTSNLIRTLPELDPNLAVSQTSEPLPDKALKPPQIKRNRNKTNKGVSNDTPDPPANEPEKPKKEPKPRKVKEPPSSDHQRVIGHYFTRFQDKFGVKPVFDGGKDGKIIKDLLAQKSADELIALLDAFFRSEDAWIKDSGYTIGAFKTQVNKLIAQGRKGRQSTPEDSRKKEIIKKLYLT